MRRLLVGGLIFCGLQVAYAAEREGTGREQVSEVESALRAIGRLRGAQTQKGEKQTSAEDLTAILSTHGRTLIGGDESMEAFRALSLFCGLVTSSPHGKGLVPDLLAVMPDLEAPSSKVSEINNWEKIGARIQGGRIGLLMSCILDLSGEEGFNQMFTRFESEGQIAKIGLLLELTSIRKDRAKYLGPLSERSGSNKDEETDKLVRALIRRIRESMRRDDSLQPNRR